MQPQGTSSTGAESRVAYDVTTVLQQLEQHGIFRTGPHNTRLQQQLAFHGGCNLPLSSMPVMVQLLLGSGASLVPLLLLLLLLLPIGRPDHQIMPDAFNAGLSTATARTRNSYSLCGAAVVDSATATQLMLLCCGWWQPAQLILLSCGWW
jgi:hypothetical protein